MRTIISHAHIVNEGKCFVGKIVVEGEYIVEILREDESPVMPCECEVDATGLYLLPGVIDDHVHFRDPGLTHKADIESESRAAAAGGVTSFMDMPNTLPQTTTLEDLDAKFESASLKSCVNYSFFFGATNDNAMLLPQLDKRHVCGIKLFMGSSTGNMLVDSRDALRQIFSQAGMLIMAHCEDQHIIEQNTARVKTLYGDDADVALHPVVRDAEACFKSTEQAVRLAHETGARLHIAHVSTARELALFSTSPLDVNKKITAEVCVSHLYFCDADYARLGTRIKCNPAIKSDADRQALRQALIDGRLDVVGTDHAPHLLSEKQGGCLKAVSGMPMIQFSLVTMLELVHQGVISIEQLVEKMCHAPARLFSIKQRGFLRVGYKADFVLVRPQAEWRITAGHILSKCAWSPLEGETFHWQVEKTYVNGDCVYADGHVNGQVRGQSLEFDR